MFDEEYFLLLVGRRLKTYGINTYNHQNGGYDYHKIDNMIANAKIEGFLSYEEWNVDKVAEKVALYKLNEAKYDDNQ